VTRNLAERLSSDADRAAFVLPPVIEEMIRRGWIGAKAGQGFYKKDSSGEILTLDPASMTYRAKQPARLPAIEAARAIEDPAARIAKLFGGTDEVGKFLKQTLGATLVYTARVAPDIAHSVADVDRALRWGFGWELGPFETWDAIGIPAVLEAVAVTEPPPLVRDALTLGSWQLTAEGASHREAGVSQAGTGWQILRTAKERTPVIRKNAGASLVDLGEGVLAVEFHSKMNAIGGDTIQMLQAGVKEATTNFRALVVGNDAVNFSAGANLMLLLLEAQDGNWDEIELMIRAFQGATQALKYADVPVVVAPAGMVLGGGCEIVLHGDRAQAAAETYMGLVEVGVGLIPAGGGTKEMLARATDGATPGADLLPLTQRVFETIGFGKVSTSGADAVRHGYLRAVDNITMNRDRLMADAKAHALARVPEYVRPQPRSAIPVGGDTVQAALKLGVHLAWRAGRISDHDALIGRTLARILTGGSRTGPATVTEQELLDLEREAFLSLCGHRKTQERIGYTLKTGKSLRN
jgi:3-hydroxyacyl-CoA dehydrogenase